MTKNLTKKEREAFAIVGGIGGRATAKRLGKKHMSTIGKRGAENRWKNHESKK